MAVREPFNPMIPVAFAPVVTCFWLIVSSSIADVSVWKLMGSRYAPERRPHGIRYFWRSLRLTAFARYNHCINVTVSTQTGFRDMRHKRPNEAMERTASCSDA